MFSRIPTLHILIGIRIRMLVVVVVLMADLVAEGVMEDVAVIVLCSAIFVRSLDMWLQIVGTSPQLLSLLIP